MIFNDTVNFQFKCYSIALKPILQAKHILYEIWGVRYKPNHLALKLILTELYAHFWLLTH